MDEQFHRTTKLPASVYMCLSMAETEISLTESVLWKVVHSTKELHSITILYMNAEKRE